MAIGDDYASPVFGNDEAADAALDAANLHGRAVMLRLDGDPKAAAIIHPGEDRETVRLRVLRGYFAAIDSRRTTAAAGG